MAEQEMGTPPVGLGSTKNVDGSTVLAVRYLKVLSSSQTRPPITVRGMQDGLARRLASNRVRGAAKRYSTAKRSDS